MRRNMLYVYPLLASIKRSLHNPFTSRLVIALSGLCRGESMCARAKSHWMRVVLAFIYYGYVRVGVLAMPMGKTR